jgi:hypothetical protein
MAPGASGLALAQRGQTPLRPRADPAREGISDQMSFFVGHNVVCIFQARAGGRRALLGDFCPTHLEHLLQLVSHHTAAYAALHGPAEARDLLGKGVARVHNECSARDR